MVLRLLLAFLFILSSGCSLWEAGRPAYGGTLTARLKSDIPLINPLVEDLPAQRALRLVFAGLTRIDASLEVQPDLAVNWEISPNGLVWTFRLREDLRWHDGKPLTADDVVYTYRYLMQAEPLSIVEADLQQMVENVSVVDGNSVRLTLRRVFAPLLVDTTVPILPKHIWSELEDPRRTAVNIGSGPFKVAEHMPGQAIVLTANPDYYGGRPYLDRVAFMVAGEQDTLRAIDDGQVHLSEVDFESLTKVPLSYNLHAYTELGYNYVGFNMREGRLFADRRLRLAWAKAVDKESLVAESTSGREQPIWGPIPLASWAFDAPSAPTMRQPEDAKRLLAESGWRDSDGDGVLEKDGRRLSLDLLVRADARDRVLAAQIMAKQLADVGFEVRVLPADFSTVMAARRRPPFDFDAILMGWNLGPDPDTYYLFASGQIPSEEKPELLNYVGFKNLEYDRLAVEARTTLDYRKRRQLYAQVQTLLAEDLPYYFLWSERSYLAASPRLKGPMNLSSPMYLWNVEKWYLSP